MKSWVILIAIGICTCIAYAGGNHVGNGTDYVSADDEVAWFLARNRPIRYCVERAVDFPIPLDQIHPEINGTFNTWTHYLEQRLPSEPGFSRQLVSIEKCDGSEDLKFAFGATDSLIAELRRAHPRAFALSYLASYDRSEGWGKGVIWLPLDQEASGFGDGFSWRLGSNLHGILLHEWGHVFGCPHVDDTIMSPKIFSALQRSGIIVVQHKQLMNSIDHQRFLFLPGASAETFAGTTREFSEADSVMRFLLNRATLSPQLNMQLIYPGFSGGELALTVQENSNFHRFPIRLTQSLTYVVLSKIFTRYTDQTMMSLHSASSSWLATLVLPRGEVQVIIATNAFRPLVIKILNAKPSEPTELFYSDWVN